MKLARSVTATALLLLLVSYFAPDKSKRPSDHPPAAVQVPTSVAAILPQTAVQTIAVQALPALTTPNLPLDTTHEIIQGAFGTSSTLRIVRTLRVAPSTQDPPLRLDIPQITP